LVYGFWGFVASADGDYGPAGDFLEESLALYRRLGSDADIAIALGYLGDVALQRHDLERASHLFNESSALLTKLQYKIALAYPLRRLGQLARLRGDSQLAVRLCVESLTLNREVGERQGIAASLVGLAHVADAQGQPELAIQLLGTADAVVAAIGPQLLPFDREQLETITAALRAQVEAVVWDAAWEVGRCMSLDEAVQSAVELSRR
jgi:tetratricopeptide (TPR) repeat protein